MTRMGTAAVAASLLILPGCVTTPAADAPVFRRSVAVDYAALAACAYRTLDRSYPATIKLTDLRGVETIHVRQAGRGAEVEIRGLWTIQSPTYYSERTWRDIAACLPPA